jgi:hypothetical protein
MSQTFSRRDLFALLVRPGATVAKHATASEQRTQNLNALKQAEGQQCSRCRVPFQSNSDERLCPACRDAEAKNRDLMQSLFKAP